MPVSKEKVLAALSQLDPTNDEHWTDDGMPVTSVVQKIAQDPEIRRSDINAAAPTFTRETAEPAPSAEAPVATAVEPAVPSTDWKAQAKAAALAADKVLDDAKAALAAAHKAVVEATKVQQVAKAKLDLAFPPMSAADNIKQYLESQTNERARQYSQIDMAMSARRSRGWQRPKYGQQVTAK